MVGSTVITRRLMHSGEGFIHQIKPWIVTLGVLSVNMTLKVLNEVTYTNRKQYMVLVPHYLNHVWPYIM